MPDCGTDANCKLITSLYSNINNDLERQNAKLASEVQNLNTVYSTDYQKSNYKNANMADYKYYNALLFWSYYFLVLIVLYLTFKIDTNRAIKAIIVVGFITYPFAINNIEILLYELVLYIYALASGTVYSKPDL